MLINYYKGEPNSYVLSHRNGKLKQHGAGINFFYLPRTVSWIDRLGVTLANALDEPTGKVEAPVCSVPGLLLRNLFFLFTVLTHRPAFRQNVS